MKDNRVVATSVPSRTTRRVSPVPPQHGAWAFLALPVLVAVTVSPWTPVLIAMSATWIAAYPMSYFLLAIAKDRTSSRPRPGRFVRPLVTWAALVVPAGLVSVWFRPWLVWVGLAYGVSFLVNVRFARRRDERSLPNDLLFIAQCTAMVPVTWGVAVGAQSWTVPDWAGAPAHLWLLTLAVALILIGSTLHVKSLIRERADARFGTASRAFAIASLAGSAVIATAWGLPSGLWLMVPFAYCAARALLLRTPTLAPGRIGMVELVAFVLMVAAAALAGR